MDYIKLWQICACFVIAPQCLVYSVAQDVAECSPRCWNPVQLYYGVWDATYQEGVASEEDCKALCVNNGTCIGIDWIRIDNQCWFQLTALSPYKNANANHWSLANCTDECASYCWKAVKVDFHVYPENVADENHCKLRCSNTPSCNGVYWESTTSSCWLIFNETLRDAMNGLRHWDIIRNLPTRCQTAVRITTDNTSPAVSITSSTMKSLQSSTESLEETTIGCSDNLTKVIIVLAVLLGLSALFIIGLVINTVRIGRKSQVKSDVQSVELDSTYYEGVQRHETRAISEDGTYTDLDQRNPEEFAYEQTNC